MTNVFISHAATDKNLGELVAQAFGEGTPPLTTFLASRAGDIRADAEWLPAIQAALLRADQFLILLTPNSVSRPWVGFETGAAWFSNRTTVLARVSDLAPEEVPWPMGARQLYRLDQPDDLEVIFHTLGTSPRNANELAATIRNLPKRSAGAGEQAWEGIIFDGTYFAWAGPLNWLEDRQEVPVPLGLVNELRERGLTARLGRADRLTNHLARGRAQLFATDRKAWRRPVVDRGQLLLVYPPQSIADSEPAA